MPPQPLKRNPEGDHRLVRLQEDGAGVAQPDIAEEAAHDLDAALVSQKGRSNFERLVAGDNQAHALVARPRQGARQGRDFPARGGQIVTPKLGVAGEAEPKSAVALPLGRIMQGHADPLS